MLTQSDAKTISNYIRKHYPDCDDFLSYEIAMVAIHAQRLGMCYTDVLTAVYEACSYADEEEHNET